VTKEATKVPVLPTDYQTFIHLSRYARWQDKVERRETWEETVSRVRDFWINKFPKSTGDIAEAFASVELLEIMPSMRTLMSAGVQGQCSRI